LSDVHATNYFIAEITNPAPFNRADLRNCTALEVLFGVFLYWTVNIICLI